MLTESTFRSYVMCRNHHKLRHCLENRDLKAKLTFEFHFKVMMEGDLGLE